MLTDYRLKQLRNNTLCKVNNQTSQNTTVLSNVPQWTGVPIRVTTQASGSQCLMVRCGGDRAGGGGAALERGQHPL